MPISYKKQFIYIHIPKCGGSSITAALQTCDKRLGLVGRLHFWHRFIYKTNEKWLHHLRSEELEKVHMREWKSFFKFAFVRNPWDRMVSLYVYQRKRMSECRVARRMYPEIAERFRDGPSFDEWLRRSTDVKPQIQFLRDSAGLLKMDFVGRFERLTQDFDFVCARLGIKAVLPHKNETKHEPFQSYYSKEGRDLVALSFNADIEAFGYSFEPGCD